MELKILVDNMPGKCEGLVAEHGFSLWMEVDGLKWLVDCGANILEVLDENRNSFLKYGEGFAPNSLFLDYMARY